MRASAGAVAQGPAKQLPEYDKPPVVEVACSLQFQPLNQLDTAHLGLLWSHYRDRYPNTEQQSPLPNMHETFGSPAAARVKLNFQETMPVPRAWFLNEDSTRLVQVQPDHFALNWRKLETEEEYPRYTRLRADLIAELDIFERYLASEKLPAIVPDQVELSYVNHLPPVDTRRERMEPQQFLRLWAGQMEPGVMDAPEDLTFQVRYTVRDETTREPLGRLYVTLEPRINVKTQVPIYALTLVARGAPIGEGIKGAMVFLDHAHQWIVETFTAITTPEMHRSWGRTR
jgi:uncharacterized protein (TIGR04255 family)